MNAVELNHAQIIQLCKSHAVNRLFVFGSILTSNFSPDSDIDFLVDFMPIDRAQYANNYFDLKFSLEEILNRPVDLLEEKAIKNPFLKKSIDLTKKCIYG